MLKYLLFLESNILPVVTSWSTFRAQQNLSTYSTNIYKSPDIELGIEPIKLSNTRYSHSSHGVYSLVVKTGLK